MHPSNWDTPLKVAVVFLGAFLLLIIICAILALLRNYYPVFFEKLKFWRWGKKRGAGNDLEAGIGLPPGEGPPIRMVDCDRGSDNQVILGRCPTPPEPLSKEDMRALMMPEEQQQSQMPNKGRSRSRSRGPGVKKGLHGKPVDDSVRLRRVAAKQTARAVYLEEQRRMSVDSDSSSDPEYRGEREFVNISRTRPPGPLDSPTRATPSSSSSTLPPAMVSMARTRSSSLGYSTAGKRKAIQKWRESVSDFGEASTGEQSQDITLSSLNLPGPELSVKFVESNDSLSNPYAKSEEWRRSWSSAMESAISLNAGK